MNAKLAPPESPQGPPDLVRRANEILSAPLPAIEPERSRELERRAAEVARLLSGRAKSGES